LGVYVGEVAERPVYDAGDLKAVAANLEGVTLFDVLVTTVALGQVPLSGHLLDVLGSRSEWRRRTRDPSIAGSTDDDGQSADTLARKS
jgi:hypothetical protein